MKIILLMATLVAMLAVSCAKEAGSGRAMLQILMLLWH
jgi:hypothetical protein